MLEWYRNDPDPGVHGAIDWVLRHARQGAQTRASDWRQSAILTQLDTELAGRPPSGRNWYVTSERQTMSVVRGPAEFLMGSPAQESGRASDETLHRVRIPRSFAIGSKEVTVAEFRRFLDAKPSARRGHVYPGNPDRMAEVLRLYSPDDDGPQIAVTWYEAAMYCNWLSQRDGIPESQWVYPAKLDSLASGIELPMNYLRRTGYRLATEAEWEYAARAGSTTTWFFGDSPELLREYAWYAAHPRRNITDPRDPTDPQRTWPVGQLKPNSFGLFDVYGNVWEWLQDRRLAYPSGDGLRQDVEDVERVVTDKQDRVRRGGSFIYGADFTRSAYRGATGYFPDQRRDNVGFRIARTM